MIDYREILRFHSQNHGQRRIETSVHSSHQIVKSVLENAAKYGISWLLYDITNEKLDEMLNNFAKKHGFIPYAEPDYSYIHRELSKKGGNRQTLPRHKNPAPLILFVTVKPHPAFAAHIPNAKITLVI